MSFLNRSAMKSCNLVIMAHQSGTRPSNFFASLKFFSAEVADTIQSTPIDRFLNPPTGLVYGRMMNITKYTTKTDVIGLLDESNLTPERLKVEYNRGYYPLSMMVEFSSVSSYDSAIKAIGRKGRLFNLARADRSQWDAVAPYDGKAIVLQGIPSNALIDDIERFLSGCQFDASAISLPPRSSIQGPVKTVLVRFPSPTLAMHAYITKNNGFCLNNQISVKVLH